MPASTNSKPCRHRRLAWKAVKVTEFGEKGSGRAGSEVRRKPVLSLFGKDRNEFASQEQGESTGRFFAKRYTYLTWTNAKLFSWAKTSAAFSDFRNENKK